MSLKLVQLPVDSRQSETALAIARGTSRLLHAHGFCVVSETADVLYKVSSPYNAATECAIRWNDPELAVQWPVPNPVLSARDETSETFADFKARLRGAS